MADASLVLNGRRLASHAAGSSAPQAANEAADRLNRQMRCVADAPNHRFLYFIDAADGRGKVLYLRHDGDYGLVEPPPAGAKPAA